MKRLVAFLACLSACFSVYAGVTSTLLKTRLSSGSAAKAGVWLSNFSKAKSYAVKQGVPLVAVWSNGDACGNCVTFESACNSSYFRKWMKSSGCVFFFTYSGESQGKIGGTIFHWCRKNKNTGYPFVRIYWPKGKVDVAVVGNTMDGKRDSTTGGKKIAAYIKKKCSKFFAQKPAVKPYTIEFEPNGATNGMASAAAKVGTARKLPANTLIRPDYSFLGWAKTPAGAVAYKNKASVKNLTTVSNGVVTLYAKWVRSTYRTYYTGIKYTIAMSDCKGWAASTKVAGLKWKKSTGKWTGKPTKAGTFTVTFKKGSSSKKRKIVVVKDAVEFADETATQRVAAAGEPLTLDLSPSSAAGAPKSIAVTGLPEGLSYVGGIVSGNPAKVGTFKIAVTVVSALGQKLTRAFSLRVGVPDCCIGTFNGFIGFSSSNHVDALSLSNRGLFRLSAPSNANLSARVVTAKGAYSLTGLGWTKNGDGTYTAALATASGKDVLYFTVEEGVEPCFGRFGVFSASYGTSYDVYAQRSPLSIDATGAYVDAAAAAVMPRLVGKWYFKALAVGSQWQFQFATAKTATVTVTVKADGRAVLAGKIGSYKVSASSAVFFFQECIDSGYACADFPTPVTVKKTKKTMDIWLNLWFDKSNSHFNARGEAIGGARLETFQ